jgi:hypothetical protein
MQVRDAGGWDLTAARLISRRVCPGWRGKCVGRPYETQCPRGHGVVMAFAETRPMIPSRRSVSVVVFAAVVAGHGASALAQDPVPRTPSSPPIPQTPTAGAAPASPYAPGQGTPPFSAGGPWRSGVQSGPPAPASAIAPNGEYLAPFAQQTQPVYVPQSVALSGPRMIKDWQEDQPIPYGYHQETRVRKGMVIGGGITFGAVYLYTAFIASVSVDLADRDSSHNANALFLPVLGPFIQLTQTDSATFRYVLTLDGLAQAVGAAMFIYGLTTPKTVLIRNDLATVAWMPMPLGKDGTGLGLVGRF